LLRETRLVQAVSPEEWRAAIETSKESRGGIETAMLEREGPGLFRHPLPVLSGGHATGSWGRFIAPKGGHERVHVGIEAGARGGSAQSVQAVRR
jgi:hypothetical protein